MEGHWSKIGQVLQRQMLGHMPAGNIPGAVTQNDVKWEEIGMV